MELLSLEQYRKGLRAKDLMESKNEVENSLAKLNEATEDDLCEIRGIGPKTAQKIIQSAPYDDENDFIERSQVPLSVAEKAIQWSSP